jgi:nucleoside-diphosphate-sugar epimerase
MKALVTGATGFIGSHVADKLLSKGYEVRCIVRKSSNLRWLENKPIELGNASLDDKESLKSALKDIDIVFHVAGLTFAKNYDEFLKGNRDGTRNLLEAIDETQTKISRFLHVSSQTVAGPSDALENPKTEDMPPKPLTSYGKSKKAAEDEVHKFKGKIPYTIVRAPAVFGPRDTAIFDIFKIAKYGLGTLIGFDKKYVSLIHSDDLTRGMIEAAESSNTIDETYFISSEEFYTWDKVIPEIGKAFGKNILKLKIPHAVVLGLAGVSEFFGKFSKKPPVFNYEKGIDFIQSYWTCSVDKAKKDFGYSQKMSLEDGIKDTVRWYQENKWL